MKKTSLLLIRVILLCTLAYVIGCSTTGNSANDEELSKTFNGSNTESIFSSAALFTDEYDQRVFEQVVKEAKAMTLERLRRRIAEGADVNERIWGTTPLMMLTSYNSNPMVVQVLIDAGAEVNTRNDSGRTALDHAFTRESEDSTPDVVRILLAAGADVEARDRCGWTPLIWALAAPEYNDETTPALLQSLNVLLGAGADVNAAGWGLTPLMWAVTNDPARIEVAKLLIDAGADVNARRDSYTVLMYAVISNAKRWPTSPTPPFYTQTTEIVQVLIDAGADVNAQSKDGWTALMVAARYRSAEFVQIFLDAGANARTRNHEDMTAFDLAGRNEMLRNTNAYLQLQGY